MSESKLELNVKSAMRQGIIASESRAYIESDDRETREKMTELATGLNRIITQRHSAYLSARSLGYFPTVIKRLEISG